ncbi:GMC family oxidoreductase [Bradyrhizobium sp. IC3069]|uniref:GMC oxidoreductase n=1 Tax=Bradyrhizobium sp. BRP20 TaxID=2793822 RepID=UPI001CD670E5|nr:GMC family oxidoreductase [Bradyrhizobium sp. IC4059]MCA1436471.1 GMC family oxidoreductase [Bradyrhizobium sp. BRP20]MCA1519538.1 GMC family oxidoreductase [Bradyrhizobium sp. IC3069]
MQIGPALSGVLGTTTIEELRRPGAQDAIVIGGGAAGGLAALLLAEAGLRVLVLEAGWQNSPRTTGIRRAIASMTRRLADPATLRLLPPAVVPFGKMALRGLGMLRQPIQSRCSIWGRAPDSFVDDHDLPYVTPRSQPFVWIRARTLGGRVGLPGHGRQYYRLNSSDLAPCDGLSAPWPLEPGELDPWYSMIERRLALAGAMDSVPWQPDSQLSRELEPSLNQFALMAAIRARWPHSRPMLTRFAAPLDALETAALTGRLRCREGAVVRQIDVDRSGRVRGVVWFDQQSGTDVRACAPLVFLCASSLESTRILLLSRSFKGGQGLGAGSDALGRYLMDHIVVTGWGGGAPLKPSPVLEDGCAIYLPRFDARDRPAPLGGRGFGVQLYQFPGGHGRSHFTAVSFGEMLPRAENRVALHPTRRDVWGIPVLHIDCRYSEADLARARDQAAAIREIAATAGVTLSRVNERPAPPGSAIHECGTARMGIDPATSVLDPNNQCWDAQGLYVTDGACFPSQGTQNPTLTILALTARACHHAVSTVAQTRREAAFGLAGGAS